MKNHLLRLISVLLVLTVGLSACAAPPPEPDPQPADEPAQPAPPTAEPDVPEPTGEMPYPIQPGANAETGEVKSNVAYLKDPQIPEEDLALFSEAQMKFALVLFRQLQAGEKNLIFSPYSLYNALQMTNAGARGETQAQLVKALHESIGPEQAHAYLNALNQKLSENLAARDPMGTPFTLSVANALWGQFDYQFQQEFLDTLAKYYDAGMHTVDYRDPEQASRLINAWVDEKTHSKIKQLVSPDVLDAATRLVLTNAVYFKAGWLYEFNEDNTIDAPFYLIDGSSKSVPTMHIEEHYGYAKGAGYKAIELPYYGRGYSMVVIMPDKLQAYMDQLDAAQLNDLLKSLSNQKVRLAMPKFKIESSLGLVQPLQEIGVTDLFDSDAADLSGMSGTRDLFVSGVLQKAFVEVNEKGTEAAAATAVIAKTTSLPVEEDPVELNLDHPFLFLIMERSTNTILFMGTVVNP
ncbi:MAG: serpin family protein [Anaerolineaceae bacterium]|jgi:serpin B